MLERDLTIEATELKSAFRLRFFNGRQTVREIKLNRAMVTVGRSKEADITVRDQLISRSHCRLSHMNGKWSLEDLSSTNGTWLLGQEVARSVTLPLNTPVKIGNTTFELVGESNSDSTRIFAASTEDTVMDTSKTIMAVAYERDNTEVAMRAHKDLFAVTKFQRAIAMVSENDNIYAKCLGAIMDIIPATHGYFLTYDLENAAFTPKARFTRPGVVDRGESDNIVKELIELAQERHEAALSSTRQAHPRPGVKREDATVICAPLLGHNQLNGILYLRSTDSKRPLTESDLALINVIGDIAGMAIERHNLLRFNVKNERLFATGETARGLSHYIKNILFGFDGALNLLKSGCDKHNVDLAKECWSILKIHHRKLANVMLDFLNFATDLKPKFVEYDLNMLIRDTRNMLKPQFDYHGIRLDLDDFVMNNAMKVELDPEGAHRVLINLLTNAEQSINARYVSASSGKGVVSIKVKPNYKFNRVDVTISDNGIGLSDDLKRHLFDLFATTKGVAGSGLGLHVCKRIIESHGGVISAKGQEGQGCEITFQIPIHRDPLGSDTVNITHLA